MNNAYRKLMEQQCLSEEEKQSIIRGFAENKTRNIRPIYMRAAIVAICILLMVPVTAFAVERIFGISVVEIIKGTTSTDKLGTGYEVSFPEAIGRPLSDFPENIQTMENYRLVEYDTWQQAEEELGITLINNHFLFSERVKNEYAYNLKAEGIYHQVHCFAQYNGLNNQFYRATVTAAYRYNDMHITVRSVVTCDHPAISDEEENNMHWAGLMFSDEDIENITQEQYLADNGITATIVAVDRIGSKSTRYEASFFANGASYRISITPYGSGRNAEAKENLINILEAFVF